MRILILAAMMAMSANAASFSINPVTIVKAMRKAPGTTRARRISEAVLIGLTVADYRTTIRGMDRGFCELNNYLVGPDGCRVNRPKFTLVKSGVVAFAAMQEIPGWHRKSDVWNRVFLISNIGLSVPLAAGVVNNYRVLSR